MITMKENRKKKFGIETNFFFFIFDSKNVYTFQIEMTNNSVNNILFCFSFLFFVFCFLILGRIFKKI